MIIKTKILLIFTLVLSTGANAALISRLGGLAYYDDVNNLTWLADANYAQTSGYDADGNMSWNEAIGWVSTLNIGGVTGWRLPTTTDVGNDGATYSNLYEGVDYGYNITTHSEMSNMFYNILGNTAWYDTSGVETGCSPNCLSNTGPFSNLDWFFWSTTLYAPNTTGAWMFGMIDGRQFADSRNSLVKAWAVRTGDVSASVVPVPAAAWLFVTGLLGLIGVARRGR